MPRVALASLLGLSGFLLYVVAAVTLGDLVVDRHWTLQALFYAAAGILWVWPAKRLMFWAARKPG